MSAPRRSTRSGRRRWAAHLVAASASLAIALAPIAAGALEDEPGAGEALERFRAAVIAHPDDPDLLWAYARKLAAGGATRDAVAQTRRFTSSWPDRRKDARTEIARLLIDREAGAEALELLSEAVVHQPRSALAHFYRGLALRLERRIAEANRSFQLAGMLSPALRAEALLAEALGLFELGEEEAAVSLLQEILRIDPTTETAVRARLLLRQREVLDLERPWRVEGYVGFEWDDNVTLENGENEIVASGSDDFRGVFGVGASARVLTLDQGTVTVGYRYDQTDHADLDEFNLIGNTGFVSGVWQPTSATALRLDVLASSLLLDTSNEYTGGVVQPALVHSWGPQLGATRVFSRFEAAEYHEDANAFLERDAIVFGAGVEHFLPLAVPRSFVSLSGSWQRTLTQEDTDGTTIGLDGDYDYDSWRARSGLRLEGPFGVRTQLDLAYSHDRYHNNNSIFFFTLATLGEEKKRRDDVLSGRITLSREIVDHVRAEAYWRGTRRISNVDLFDYDKQVVGLLIRVSTD